MASLIVRTSCIQHYLHHNTFDFSSSFVPQSSHFVFFPSSINHSPSLPLHIHPPFCGSPSNHSRRILLCRAITPGPPPPPPEKDSSGVAASFSRIWDTVQIFFAVLFWMSLFFWASASDRNNSGRGNKRNNFRK